MKYTFEQIVDIIPHQFAKVRQNTEVQIALLDSRQLSVPGRTIFFALAGKRDHGQNYIPQLYAKGVRYFITDDAAIFRNLVDASYLLVDNVLEALQTLAFYHRRQFNIPVIGITGADHKTLVKEWLYELLKDTYHIVKSPASYNSQYGVPLSILEMNERHTLGIFEAGISQMGQMDLLEKMIQPTFGVLTNVQSLYNFRFSDQSDPLLEYIRLFKHCDQFLLPYNHFERLPVPLKNKAISWGDNSTATFYISNLKSWELDPELQIQWRLQQLSFPLLYKDRKEAVIENKLTLFFIVNLLGHSEIGRKIPGLEMPDLGVKTLAGVNNTTIIHDVFSRDLMGWSATLSKVNTIQRRERIWIVCSRNHNVPESRSFWNVLEESVIRDTVERIYVHKENSHWKQYAPWTSVQVYEDVEEMTHIIQSEALAAQTILVFDRPADSLQSLVYQIKERKHNTVLEIDLSALNKNFKAFEHYLHPQTKVMVMVKANAYGAGAVKIAHLLKERRVDYLGVAFTDEGVELRRAGIQLPIMVLNVDPEEFELLTTYQLEPEIYSLELLQKYQDYLTRKGLIDQKIHLKLDTGMHRLGFLPTQVDDLIFKLKSTNVFKIQSVFSHLSASGNKQQSAFTLNQIALFTEISDRISQQLQVSFDRHILNSAGIVRYPRYQFDMVRLGIGIYGVGINEVADQVILRPVHTLKSKISQVKWIDQGESVGYNRAVIVQRPTKVGIISIGYADGLMRLSGNGQFKVWIKGFLCPTLGNVCMDMTMIDLTDHPNVESEEEVIIFGEEYSIDHLATSVQTIPYEILTQIDQRVGRVYVSN